MFNSNLIMIFYDSLDESINSSTIVWNKIICLASDRPLFHNSLNRMVISFVFSLLEYKQPIGWIWWLQSMKEKQNSCPLSLLKVPSMNKLLGLFKRYSLMAGLMTTQYLETTLWSSVKYLMYEPSDTFFNCSSINHITH